MNSVTLFNSFLRWVKLKVIFRRALRHLSAEDDPVFVALSLPVSNSAPSMKLKQVISMSTVPFENNPFDVQYLLVVLYSDANIQGSRQFCTRQFCTNLTLAPPIPLMRDTDAPPHAPFSCVPVCAVQKQTWTHETTAQSTSLAASQRKDNFQDGYLCLWWFLLHSCHHVSLYTPWTLHSSSDEQIFLVQDGNLRTLVITVSFSVQAPLFTSVYSELL